MYTITITVPESLLTTVITALAEKRVTRLNVAAEADTPPQGNGAVQPNGHDGVTRRVRAGRIREGGVRALILSALGDGKPKTTDELFAHFEGTAASATSMGPACSKLRAEGLLKRVGNKTYQLI